LTASLVLASTGHKADDRLTVSLLQGTMSGGSYPGAGQSCDVKFNGTSWQACSFTVESATAYGLRVYDASSQAYVAGAVVAPTCAAAPDATGPLCRFTIVKID